MARWFLGSALLLFVGEASGAFPFVEAAVCDEPCPDDGDGTGDGGCPCPAGCSCCCSCSHSIRSLALDRPCSVLATVMARGAAPQSQDLPTSPEPGDILHVPRARLP